MKHYNRQKSDEKDFDLGNPNSTTMENNSESKFQELEKAKKSVRWLLDNPDGLSDMHGLAYWAGVVERLRTEIKSSL